MDFATQMPKGTFVRPVLGDDGKPIPKLDENGKDLKDDRGQPVYLAVSDVAGIQSDKLMGGLACKAGLWWAKSRGKPVYYCLDGINMDDVTNYKKVKNKAIEVFLIPAVRRSLPQGARRSHHDGRA